MTLVITLSELVGVVLFLLMINVGLYSAIRTAIRQSKCKHSQGVTESQACDAYCNACGKNLGFIGTWRDKQKERV